MPNSYPPPKQSSTLKNIKQTLINNDLPKQIVDEQIKRAIKKNQL